MGIEKELDNRLFHQREESIEHVKYTDEYQIYHAAASGNIQMASQFAKDLMKPDASGNPKNGTLSKDPIQNTRYHFVIFAAMITRLCIKYGMLQEEAYTISDLYINKMDVCTSSQKILHLQGEMVLDFTNRMAHIKTMNDFSLPVMQTIEYINKHLHDPLSLNVLAKASNLTPSYLSYIFKKETDLNLSAYIKSQKIEAAKTMLQYSEMSFSDIAEYLNFSSQSYFIACFKKATGQTPLQFRRNGYYSEIL